LRKMYHYRSEKSSFVKIPAESILHQFSRCPPNSKNVEL
jgi:ribosomal protein L34E